MSFRNQIAAQIICFVGNLIYQPKFTTQSHVGNKYLEKNQNCMNTFFVEKKCPVLCNK